MGNNTVSFCFFLVNTNFDFVIAQSGFAVVNLKKPIHLRYPGPHVAKESRELEANKNIL